MSANVNGPDTFAAEILAGAIKDPSVGIRTGEAALATRLSQALIEAADELEAARFA